VLTIDLMRKATQGGHWVNIGKVAVFGVLIVGGLWAVACQPSSDTGAALRPFFTAGFGGLIQAMGYTFIALQGAVVGGEVREPSKTLPRAMVLSLTIALVIYLPLLFVVATVE
jgi:amino acid transporter